MLSLPVISFALNKRKISELLASANKSKPVTNCLYSALATFQKEKKEKKFPFVIVETGCLFSFKKKINSTEIIPGIKAIRNSVL